MYKTEIVSLDRSINNAEVEWIEKNIDATYTDNVMCEDLYSVDFEHPENKVIPKFIEQFRSKVLAVGPYVGYFRFIDT